MTIYGSLKHHYSPVPRFAAKMVLWQRFQVCEHDVTVIVFVFPSFSEGHDAVFMRGGGGGRNRGGGRHLQAPRADKKKGGKRDGKSKERTVKLPPPALKSAYRVEFARSLRSFVKSKKICTTVRKTASGPSCRVSSHQCSIFIRYPCPKQRKQLQRSKWCV